MYAKHKATKSITKSQNQIRCTGRAERGWREPEPNRTHWQGGKRVERARATCLVENGASWPNAQMQSGEPEPDALNQSQMQCLERLVGNVGKLS